MSSNGLTSLGGGDGLAPVGGSAGLSSLGGAAPSPTASPAPLAPPTNAPRPAQAMAPPVSAPRPNYVSYDDAPNGPNKILLGGLGAFVVLLVVGAFFVFRTPPPVAAPTGYAPFTAADNTWSMETPQGWSQSTKGEAGGDKSGLQGNGVTLSSGNAKIEVTISTSAALATGQLLFGNEVVPESLGGSKASGISKLQKKAVSNNWKGYDETKQNDCPNGMGGQYMDDKKFVDDTRLYEWTANSNKFGLGGKMHGYRASEAGGDLIAAVVCECSERDWPKLKPAFRHVLGSLHEIRKPGSEKGGGMSVPGMGGTRVPL